MTRPPADDCWILRAPRLNANDDSVTVTRWLVADRSTVVAGQPIAEIETEKATSEVPAEVGGVLLHAAPAGADVAVGAPLAYVADTLEAAQAARDAPAAAPQSATGSSVVATAKARALVAARGIDLAAVAASGATVKERDVTRHLAGQGGLGASAACDPRLELVGDASAHALRVARDLRAAVTSGTFTTLAYRLDLRGPERMVAAELAQGRAVSLLAIALLALGRTLPAFPALRSRLDRGKLYRYRDIDVAFAARTDAGALHAPVVRGVDRLDLDAIARECARLAKAAMRGKLDARDVGGACFTVSLIATANVEAFVALPPPLQTAILAIGARRHEIALIDGKPVAHPVATATVTYDHALADGVMVAQFCATLDRALNPEAA